MCLRGLKNHEILPGKRLSCMGPQRPSGQASSLHMQKPSLGGGLGKESTRPGVRVLRLLPGSVSYWV